MANGNHVRVNLMGHSSKIVKFYKYRKATVRNVFVKIEDESQLYKGESETLWKTVEMFLKDNNQKIDNHICWTLDNGIHVMWSDNVLKFGTEIEERSW